MTDWLLEALIDNGLPLIALVTFLSCLALPVPSSLAMLTAGAISTAGDLPLAGLVAAALAGALAGDQAGFLLGRGSTAWLRGRIAGRPKRAALYRRAQRLTDRWGGTGVFLSRWLASPLGPYVNVAAGAARMARLRFTLWAALGEAIWVSLYLGLGRLFATRIDIVSELARDASFLLAGLAVMALAAVRLSRGLRRHTAHNDI